METYLTWDFRKRFNLILDVLWGDTTDDELYARLASYGHDDPDVLANVVAEIDSILEDSQSLLRSSAHFGRDDGGEFRLLSHEGLVILVCLNESCQWVCLLTVYVEDHRSLWIGNSDSFEEIIEAEIAATE